ncbi:MAG: glycosyltransferase [Flavobacteriales bacterium]|nr:glycosyltransferase [Flavobacteriales bacterium]
MLSVLVPIYNFDVVSFINDIYKQCEIANIEFEILCYDDCSSNVFKSKNNTLANRQKITYFELQKNIGRSKIRNLLAENAKFDNLLFVDCDSKTVSDFYIKNYLNTLTTYPVIYGGRSYESFPPSDPNLYLRWFYGIKREVKLATERTTEPYRNFMTNNFVIDKAIVLKIPFDESLDGYGYEDILFAQQLKKSNISIHHIDNSLVHVGLENTSEFLKRTANGMKNLAQIIRHNQVDEDIKIYRVYKKINRTKSKWIIKLIYALLKKYIRNNLKSNTPNLLYFDLFKLQHLMNEMKS